MRCGEHEHCAPGSPKVHRADKLKGRRKAHAARGARDEDLPVLERLPQRLERRPLELGELVEEQHAGWARLASPGRSLGPPPTIAAVDAL